MGCWEVYEESTHECKNCGRHTHNTQPGGPTQSLNFPLEEISDLVDQLSFHTCMELTLRLPSPYIRSPQWQLSSRIWQQALGGESGVKPCTSPAGMQTECAAARLN